MLLRLNSTPAPDAASAGGNESRRIVADYARQGQARTGYRRSCAAYILIESGPRKPAATRAPGKRAGVRTRLDRAGESAPCLVTLVIDRYRIAQDRRHRLRWNSQDVCKHKREQAQARAGASGWSRH